MSEACCTTDSSCSTKKDEHEADDKVLKLFCTLEGHVGAVWNVAWSNAGSLLASCGEDKTIRVWKRTTIGGGDSWTCVAVLDDAHTRTVRSIAWSPCDHFLCACSFDGTTSVWELTDSNGTASFENVAALEGHENEVKRVAWSPNGELLATCGRDKTVWVWEVGEGVASGEFDCIAICSGHAQDVKSVSWHPHREAVFSTSYDDTVKVWEAREDDDEWCCTSTLTKHTSTVWDLAFEADGRRFASCSADLSVVVWAEKKEEDGGNKVRWTPVATLERCHTRAIYSISWSNDHGAIATGSGDNAISVLVEKAPSAFVKSAHVDRAHDGDVNCIRWNPGRGENGRFLASCSDDGRVRVWEYAGGGSWGDGASRK